MIYILEKALKKAHAIFFILFVYFQILGVKPGLLESPVISRFLATIPDFGRFELRIRAHGSCNQQRITTKSKKEREREINSQVLNTAISAILACVQKRVFASM